MLQCLGRLSTLESMISDISYLGSLSISTGSGGDWIRFGIVFGVMGLSIETWKTGWTARMLSGTPSPVLQSLVHANLPPPCVLNLIHPNFPLPCIPDACSHKPAPALYPKTCLFPVGSLDCNNRTKHETNSLRILRRKIPDVRDKAMGIISA